MPIVSTCNIQDHKSLSHDSNRMRSRFYQVVRDNELYFDELLFPGADLSELHIALPEVRRHRNPSGEAH